MLQKISMLKIIVTNMKILKTTICPRPLKKTLNKLDFFSKKKIYKNQFSTNWQKKRIFFVLNK